MSRIKNSRKYARMFLSSTGMEQKPLEELALVSALSERSRDFRSVLTSPLFGPVERAAALGAVKGKLGLSDVTVKYVEYLAASGVARGLAEILAKAVAIYSEEKGKAEATVLSPVALTPEMQAKVKAALGKITARDVTVKYAEDASLLGGVLVKVGSTMYDYSIKGQLRLLKEELIKG